MNPEAKIINFILKAVGAKRIVKRLLLKPNRPRKFQVPRRLERKFETNRFTIDKHTIVSFSPKYDKKNKHIIFLHGGAYVIGPYKAHWWVMEQLVKKSGFTLSYIDYPLAPEFTYKESNEMVFKAYSRLLELYPNDHFYFIGDSAGGGLSLSLAQRLRDQTSFKMPEKLVLLSPWVDISMSNPEIKDMAKKDLLLDPDTLLHCAKLYAGGLDLKNKALSPLYGEMQDLKDIAIFMGTREIFLPDCRILKKKIESSNTKLYYKEYEDMQHDWIVFKSRSSTLLIDEVIQYLVTED